MHLEHSVRQDSTDLEKCLSWLMNEIESCETGTDKDVEGVKAPGTYLLVVIGGLGGNLSQALSNINTMAR